MRLWPLALLPLYLSSLSYDVQFLGLNDPKCLNALMHASDVIATQQQQPASVNALRYRLESDLPNLMKVLRAFAYYDSAITYEIELMENLAHITFFIHSGRQYTLASYEVFTAPSCAQIANLPACCPLKPEQLGLKIDQPALSLSIVNAELAALNELARCGHPLATIDKRRVIVDMETKQIDAAACVDEGPLAKFGPSTIFGLRYVEPKFIERNILWTEGRVYDADLVEETQNKLLATNLFSSVMIAHADKLDEQGELPMRLRITEAKYKQLSIGLFYATVDGPGASFSWSNRNVRGMGETLSIEGNFSTYALTGKIIYKKPDFLSPKQTLRAQLSAAREAINPYTAFSYRAAGYIDKKINKTSHFSAGIKAENIKISDSASNGLYVVMGLPIFAKYDRSNDALNPTSGYSIVYSITPYQTLNADHSRFAKQRLTLTLYAPLAKSERFVLALRAQAGSIAGAAQKKVPLTKLFLGGSEDDLRGYRYKTVSPLNRHHKPLGGRGAVFATAETRIRITNSLGLVPFADFGTVSKSQLPKVNVKWYKSVGVGVRYFTYFGPLRFDIGFPLDRRKIDPAFRIYASVGQTF